MRHLISCVTLAIFGCLSWTGKAQGPQVEWFELLEEGSRNWDIQLSDSPDQFELVSKVKAAGSPLKIMILFPKSSSAYDTATAQILTVFSEKELNARFTVIHFGGELEKGLQALEYAEKQKFDLIFSMGSQSTAFVFEHYQRKDGIPVVSICSKDPVLLGQIKDYDSGSGTNLALTSLDVPISSQMAYLRQLKPGLNQIAVLYAKNNVSAVKTQVTPLREICERMGIKIMDVVVENQSQARAELAQKIPEVITEMKAVDPNLEKSIFWITGSTSVFREIETINKASDRIPVLSAVPNVVRPGQQSAVLSIGVSFENNAQLAALYGFKILTRQARASDLAVGVVSPPDIAINFKKSREIGLRIPFSFFESASIIYDHNGVLVREKGQNIKQN